MPLNAAIQLQSTPKNKGTQTFAELTPTEKKISVAIFKRDTFKKYNSCNLVYIKTLMDEYEEFTGIYQMLKIKQGIKFIHR